MTNEGRTTRTRLSLKEPCSLRDHQTATAVIASGRIRRYETTSEAEVRAKKLLQARLKTPKERTHSNMPM